MCMSLSLIRNQSYSSFKRVIIALPMLDLDGDVMITAVQHVITEFRLRMRLYTLTAATGTEDRKAVLLRGILLHHDMESIKDAFDLAVTSQLRVGGTVLEGKAILNIPLLHLFKFEEVHVSLCGDLTTYVALLLVFRFSAVLCAYHLTPLFVHRRVGFRKELIHIVRDVLGIWTRSPTGDYLQAQGEHIVRIPFRFDLPIADPWPSGKYGKIGRMHSTVPANIDYYVVIVGVQSNGREVKLRRPFQYLPPHPRGAALSQSLKSGPWTGGWKVFEDKMTMNKVPLRPSVDLGAMISVRINRLD